MHWLNANSGAIQALGSLASVVITAVLAFITWKYVRLTDKLLGEQLQTKAARYRELRTNATLISSFLGGLPSMDDPRLRTAFLGHSNDLRDFPFGRFRALASEVSTEAAAQAAELEIHITWLINLFHEIRSAPPPRSVNQPLGPPRFGMSKEYDWNHFPKRNYDTHWRFAQDALRRLVNQLDMAEGLPPS